MLAPAGSGTIDITKLQKGMLKFNGSELDEHRAAQLLGAFDADGDGRLRLEDFAVEDFQAALERFQSEEEEAERRAQVKERRQRQAERKLEEYYQSLPEANEDTGLLTRLASVLCYVLPLVDAAPFGLPLLKLFPAVQPLFMLLVPALQLLEVVPFGQLLLFVAMQTLAGNTDLPVLLRFNLRMAVLLDVCLFLPSILKPLVSSLVQEPIPDDVQAAFACLVVLPVVACAAYAAACSLLLGLEPRGVPFLSEAAERSMGKTRPRLGDDDEGAANDA